MPLIVNTNVSSLNTQRFLSNNTNALQKSMERLSSGYRINKAGDDAAGLQLSETLRAQIRGSQKALDNTQDGINVLNLADGALQQITDNLQRMRELAVQGANDTYSAAQRSAINAEISQLSADIDRIAKATQFNGKTLLDGNTTAMVIHLGPNSTANDLLDVASAFTQATALGIGASSLDVSTAGAASSTITNLDTALAAVNSQRGRIGAFTNRLEGAANNLSIAIENFSASESRIRNVDVAQESANLTRNQILQQASAAMLAQANSAPQLALQLLQG